ncbi:MAG: O-acetylserine/cysteine efflux transporter [Brevundimonas sp.]|mgnify:FL=1|jgi:O-acetylserine/cysteine efflux transporter|tara:strand:- start:1573 stop:2445 length:873 start_codon:yes stop_codon:yes gene_type:complete
MTSKQILLALIVPITWGLGFTLAKIGLEQFPTLLIMSIRFGIAGLVLVWFTKPPWGHMREIFMVALIGSTIQYGLTYNGLRGIDASTGAILVQLEGPILALMGVFLLKEKLGITRSLGMGLAVIGVIIIAGEPRLDGQLDSVLLLIVGSAVWAIAQIMVSRLKGISGITILAWVAIMATPQMLIASLIIEDGQWLAITTASYIDWSIILYLALIMTVLGYSVWYHLLSSVDVSKVSPFLMLLPITSIIAGMILLDEKFTSSMAIGGLMIMAGVASTLINWNWPKKTINLS